MGFIGWVSLVQDMEKWRALVINNTSVALVREQTIPTERKRTTPTERERTIPTERPQLVGEVRPIFADTGCHVISVTDPYGRNLGFIDRSR
jgi:hypothetical protein